VIDAKQQVLDAIKAAGKPVSAGEVATTTGLERKDVDKAMDALKKDGTIVSPVRCKWEPS
jgi:biotin operon repressor